jgi:hypothetical protein
MSNNQPSLGSRSGCSLQKIRGSLVKSCPFSAQ